MDGLNPTDNLLVINSDLRVYTMQLFLPTSFVTCEPSRKLVEPKKKKKKKKNLA